MKSIASPAGDFLEMAMQIQTHDLIDTTFTLNGVATAEQALELIKQTGRVCMIERVDWDPSGKLSVRLIPHNGTAVFGGTP